MRAGPSTTAPPNAQQIDPSQAISIPNDPTPTDLLKAKADLLSAKQAKFYTVHDAAEQVHDDALFELRKLTVLSGTWADPARNAVTNEAKRIITSAVKTYEAAVAFMESTRDFSFSAFDIDRAWRKKAAADNAALTQALEKSEQTRLLERFQTGKERDAERETMVAEIDLASSECVIAEQQGLAALDVTNKALATDLHEAEVYFHFQLDFLQAALDRERRERKNDQRRRMAALHFERAAKEREMEETARILGVLNSERKEKTSSADEIRSLRRGVEELYAQKEELRIELSEAAARQVEAVDKMKQNMMTAMTAMEAKKQRENDTLSAEINRLRSVINTALEPSVRPPSGTEANQRAFAIARQELYYETLKASGVRPDMLTERVKETISWRAQRQQLEHPVMSHRAPPLYFGAAPPVGQKPNKDATPSPRASASRLKPAQAQSHTPADSPKRPSSARPGFSVTVSIPRPKSEWATT